MTATAGRRIGVGLAAVVVSIAVAAAVVTGVQQRGRAGSAGSGNARRIGALTRGTLRFALNLQLRQRELDSYLTHVVPGVGGGTGLTAREFGTRFGQGNFQLTRLRAILNGLGIEVAHLYPQRTAMLVSSGVAQASRVFTVRFGRYVAPDGRRFFAPDRSPQIPRVLAPYVTGIADLSDEPTPPADIPSNGLTPLVTAKAYDITPLWAAGYRGQGQTIAIATQSGAINPTDVIDFSHRTGIRPNIEIKPVDGGSKYSPSIGSDTEVDLDLQVVMGVAPQARIIDYQGPAGSNGPTISLGRSLGDIYNAVEQDGQAKIVSTSYALCETQAPSGDIQLADNALKALEASNVTTFVASGDTGAYGCLHAIQIQPGTNLPSQFTDLSVDYPSSSPYALAVGGTRLELRTDGSYLTESVWGDPISREGSGGGVSTIEPRPAWQRGPGVNEPSVNPQGLRQVPDVSGPSDPSSGFFVCVTYPGTSGPACAPGFGGTSAGTPFWAASLLLVQQYAAAHGAGSLARCFAGPILYDLAATHQPVPPFHQVTVGDNGYYSAAPGWNFATGLGTPDVFNLAEDYAAFLKARSSRSCPF